MAGCVSFGGQGAFEGTKNSTGKKKGRPHGTGHTAGTGRTGSGLSERGSGGFVRVYRRYHAWRAPFPLWARIVCRILFWAVIATATYVAIGSLCGAILIAAPLLGFLGLASSKQHDGGIDWSDDRMGGRQPRITGPEFQGSLPIIGVIGQLPDVTAASTRTPTRWSRSRREP